MSTQITTAMTKQYESNCQQVVQQVESRARDKAMVKDMTGAEKDFMDYVGKTAPRQNSTQHGDTQYSDTPHSRRMITTIPWYVADLIDRPDKAKVLIDPQSAYVQSFRAGFNRHIDYTLFRALNGDAWTGKEGTTKVVLPASQKIGVQYGTTPAADIGLTVEKLIGATEILNIADVPTAEEGGAMYERWMAIGPKQVSDLLRATQVGSSDYNLVKPLVDGKVVRFMGFNFVMSNQLPLVTTAVRACLAWVTAGLGFGLSYDITSTVDRMPGKKNAIQVFMELMYGAARLQEELVVEVACKEA